MKKYRRPKVSEGEIKIQMGRCDDHVDMCIYYGDNVMRCDRALIMNYLCAERFSCQGDVMPSLVDELKDRGYDMDSFKFSINLK